MASHKESSLQVVVRTEALCSIVCYGALLLLFAIQTMLAHQLDWRLSVQKLTALHILTTGHWTLDTGHQLDQLWARTWLACFSMALELFVWPERIEWQFEPTAVIFVKQPEKKSSQ